MHFASECNTFALVYRVMRLCEWQNKWWFFLCHVLKAFDSHHFFIFSQIIMIMHLNGTWKHTDSSIHQELINYNCFNKWNQFDRLFQFLCHSFDVVVAAAAVFHLRSMQNEKKEKVNWRKNERFNCLPYFSCIVFDDWLFFSTFPIIIGCNGHFIGNASIL